MYYEPPKMHIMLCYDLQAKLDSRGILDRQGQREIEGVMEILDLLEPVAQLAQRVTQVLVVVMVEMESQEDKVFLEEMDFKVNESIVC